MSGHPQHLSYRPEVDGLRALAVVPVILFHAGFEWFSGGFIGVDVFFVISGYLITSIILAERAAGRFSIVGFYERRARRILPALFFVVVLCLPFAWLWMTPLELRDFGRSVVAVMLFASNMLFWATSGYFDASSDEKPLLHTWSLGVEEQYYLLFPLLVLLSWRLGRRHQAWLIFGLAVLSLALSEWAWRFHANANFYLAPTRAWELLTGSLLAFAAFETPLHRQVGKHWAQLLSGLGLILVIASVFVFDKSIPFPGLYALIPTLGTALILGFSGGTTLTAWVLSRQWIVMLGLVSYSAYLWHQPLFAFARIRSPERPSEILFLLLGLLAIGLAFLSWRFVERPFRNRNRISRNTVFAFSIAGSLAFMAIGISFSLMDGLPSRLSPSARGLLETAIPSPKREACHTGGRNFTDPLQACTYFNDNTTWAVLGDSHMVEPAYVLAEQLATRQQGLVHLTFSGCPPALLFESAEPGCTRWLNAAVARLETDSKIRNVVVGFRYSSHLFGDQLPVYPRIPDSPLRIEGKAAAESRELLWKSFAAILSRLQAAGKRVFVMAPIPELGRPVQQNILASEFKGDASSGWGAPRAYFEARNSFILEKFRSLPWSESLVQVRPSDALCNENQCAALLDGHAMYFDDDHLSLSGARRVFGSLDPALLE